MRTPLITHFLVRWNAQYFVRALYLALLGRDADEHGLTTYCAELARHGNLAAVAAAIVGSEEAWSKVILARPEAIVTAAFRGLLGRDPEPEALAAHSQNLGTHRDLGVLLGDIGGSEEHWRRLVAVHAKAVVRASFLALLKREPDPEAMAIYAQELRQTADLSVLLSVIAESAEHWELLLGARKHSDQLLSSDDLPALLAEAIKSPRIWSELAALRFPQPASACDAYEQDAWVFIHAHRTGGTSLQNMLTEIFGDGVVYREWGDTLYRRSPAELAQYSVFAGHFDLASIAYIPRRIRRLVTFLREPRQRLLSLYRFLRAHEPISPDFEGANTIANRLDAVEFFRSVIAFTSSDFWNHLTWCVMGQRKWNAYRQVLMRPGDRAEAGLLADIRAEIRSQLQQFAFIGLQEDFSYSCERLFELIGARVPHVRHDHSIEALSANSRYFKNVQKRPLTPQLQQALAPLVQLDDIVYEEGTDLYSRCWGRVADAGSFQAF